MKSRPWRNQDPLYRGDGAAPELPDPSAKTSLVEHILYIGGRGRPTPFTSTTESEETAEYFAGPKGAVWVTDVRTATRERATHLPRKQLLQDLRGYGRGRAKWTSAWDVVQAASYVRQWSEHLLEWSSVDTSGIRTAFGNAFAKRP